jgi:hypothetical protein
MRTQQISAESKGNRRVQIFRSALFNLSRRDES